MFKFQRIISGGQNWTDNLYKEEEYIGTIGMDKYGIFINIKRDLTLQEIQLLITQVTNNNPDLLAEKIEINKEE